MDEEQREIFREALLDNIRERGAKDVNQFIESLPENERKRTIFPFCSCEGISDEQTGYWYIHEACKLGKFDTFTVLVSYSMKYGVDVTVKNNEGYSVLDIATLHGRKRFAEWLENLIGLEKLVPVTSLQTLVGMACKAGNREMTDHWISKMTERLNRPPCPEDFVSGMDPVTEAVKGGHNDLACEMFNRNIVRITESMYVQTGSFLLERLDELVEQEYKDTDNEEQQIHRAHWHSRNIWYLEPTWLHSPKIQSSSLRTIDLGSNHLETLPVQLLWDLPHLQYLLLNNNELVELPASYLPSNIESLSLIKLDLSHNELQEVPIDIFRFPKLEILNLSYNHILRLPADLEQDNPTVYAERCRSLTKLDVSHNKLGTLPLWITRCAMQLDTLNISYNEMEGLLPSWKCTLKELDASCNNISEMSLCDLHTHWAHSLTNLNLSSNDFSEIPSTVCQLTLLNSLDISRNAIGQLPPEEIWTTRHMIKLNLSNNKLRCNFGDGDSSSVSTHQATFYNDLVLPKVLRNTLKQLFLGSNQLQNVPESVCELKQLALLDLSGNADLTKLPYALCRLRHLFSLRLNHTPITAPAEVTPLLDKPSELLKTLREKYENSKSYNNVKIVIAGPRNAGKTTLVRCLWGTEAPSDGLDTGQDIDIVNRKFKPQGFGVSTLQRTLTKHEETLKHEIEFNVWDLKGGESLELIHRCCVTPNTVYLLVWDLNGDESEVDKLLPWWLTIQSVAPGSQVILVGTRRFSTRRKHNTMEKFIESIENDIEKKFCKGRKEVNVFFVDSKGPSNKQHGFHRLQSEICKCVNVLKFTCRGSKYSFSKLMIPETFLLLKERIANETIRMKDTPDQPLILTDTDIQIFANEIQNSCLENEDDLQEVLDFLTYTGSLIHVSDRKYGLGRLYFPNPSWLCDVVKTVTGLQQSELQGSGKISKDKLKALCQASGFGTERFKEYEQLLKSFEIIMPSAEDNTTYWIPCKLPAEKPAMEFMHARYEGPEPKQLRRVYELPYIPPGFWIRLVSRIITSVEQKKRDQGLLKPRSRTMSGSGKSGIPRTQSMMGMGGYGRVDGTNVQNVYWQTGILVFHDTGELLVEDLAASYMTFFTFEEEKAGVCITVKCRLGRFSIMGLVVDELESLISNWYPDLAYSQMHRLIPCPVCEEHLGRYRDRSDSERRRASDPPKIGRSAHLFSVEELGTRVCSKIGEETVECPSHVDPLIYMRSIIPEMFFDDLTVTMLSQNQFKFSQNKRYKLGSGGFGDVYRGTYNGGIVAVKCFAKENRPHASSATSPVERKARAETDPNNVQRRALSKRSVKGKMGMLKKRLSSLGEHSKQLFTAKGGNDTSTSSGIETSASTERNMASKESGSNSSNFDPEVINSFTKLRNELSVMCRLQHPFIVGLIGASLQGLCFAMEFAPLGDLNSFLQDKFDTMRSKLTLGKHIEIQGTIVGRNLSFKITSQIANGVIYLHTMGITHADLKPANVLVFSKDVEDLVNVKITDYGISRNMDRSGNKGRVGTPGFRAPEIGTDFIFDKEADWFSYGRLLYQLFTGVSPFHDFQQESQVKEIDSEAEKSRFPFVRYTLLASFPHLIALMRACWRENPHERPRDSRILAVLRDPGILALRHVILLEPFAASRPVVTTSATSTNEEEVSDDYKIHTWTGGVLTARRRYQLISGDQGRPFAPSELHIGAQVYCVVQVGNYNLIGTTGRQIHIFECPTESGTVLREVTMLQVEASVFSLHYQKSGGSGYLFAGLRNGTVLVYEANPVKPPEQWVRKSVIEVGDKNMTCNCFQPVRNGKEIWASCGNTLRIINTLDLSVAPGVITVDIDKKQDGACIAGNGDTIWCSLKGSNKVMVYSTQTRELVNVISLPQDQHEYASSKIEAITALVVVKDTLWIGKSTGDIVVIGIGAREITNELPALGVLSLNQMLSKPKGCVSQLLRVGKDRILACMHYKDEGHDSGYLVIWENWGSEEFGRFQRFIGGPNDR